MVLGKFPFSLMSPYDHGVVVERWGVLPNWRIGMSLTLVFGKMKKGQKFDSRWRRIILLYPTQLKESPGEATDTHKMS
jgi:hypothetical protein